MTKEDMNFFEGLFRSLESEMRASFDAQAARQDQTNARLERIGGLVNGGGRAIARMIDWSEKTDVSLAELLRRQQALEDRVRELINNAMCQEHGRKPCSSQSSSAASRKGRPSKRRPTTAPTASAPPHLVP
jgi:hypothetical protein